MTKYNEYANFLKETLDLTLNIQAIKFIEEANLKTYQSDKFDITNSISELEKEMVNSVSCLLLFTLSKNLFLETAKI